MHEAKASYESISATNLTQQEVYAFIRSVLAGESPNPHAAESRKTLRHMQALVRADENLSASGALDEALLQTDKELETQLVEGMDDFHQAMDFYDTVQLAIKGETDLVPLDYFFREPGSDKLLPMTAGRAVPLDQIETVIYPELEAEA